MLTVEANEETLGGFRVAGFAVVVLENLERTRVRHIQELEIGVKLIEAVVNRCSAESPFVISHKSTASERCPAIVVLNGLSFVKDDPLEKHSMESPPLCVVRILPPSTLFLGSDTCGGWVVLGIRAHNLGIRCENDVVSPKNLKRSI